MKSSSRSLERQGGLEVSPPLAAAKVTRVQGSVSLSASETAALIDEEIFKKRISNNEYRMSNIEVRNYIDIYKRQSVAIQSFEILRLDILRFCGLLLN